MNNVIKKLDDVINAIPEAFKDVHPLSPHWYISELCRYLQNEIRKNELSRMQYAILKNLTINEIRQGLHYKGLSLID